MMSGKYAMGKAITGNLMNNGSANQNDTSTTRTAISAAQVTVGNKTTDTSKEQLQDSNGQAVSTDTSNTNRVLAKADVAGLQQLAQDEQAGNNLLFKTMTTIADPISRAMTADKKIVLQTCQADGKCTQKEVAAKDVKVGPDGKVYVFNNGILNNEEEALVNAAKQSGDQANQQGVYVIINPHTGNIVSEIFYAGVDKLNEVTGMLPISNASEANIDLRDAVQAQGGQVKEVDHSRGSLASSIATAEQIKRGETNVAIDTVTFNGAAANAERMANRINNVTGGTGKVQQATHKDDTVSTFVGGNAPTGGRDASFGAAHTTYTGKLSPAQLPNGKENDLRKKTDSTWGEGQISKPVVVLPSK